MKTSAAHRCLVLLVLAITLPGLAQSAAPKAAADSSSEGVGFSIESEMLTYRALESNSEAVACDITGYLNGTAPDFNSGSGGSVCEVRAGSHNASVVLLPFDRSVFIDFQVWREDMTRMATLQAAAAVFDCPAGSRPRGATTAAAAAANSALMLTPAGPMISAAQGVLGLLSSEEAASAVKGTVEDQAFLDGVGRQLRALKVQQVIMPTGYPPSSLMPIDRGSSPFFSSYDHLLQAEGCLATTGNQKPDQQTDQTNKDGAKNSPEQDLINKIENFRSTLEPATSKPSATGTSAAAKAGESAAQPTATAASDHLGAVLLADGLAQALGVDSTGKLPDGGASQHLLLLKALESGGSIARNSNILGTKIRYSGGFVGTYALFNMSGDLECSGNVFEFGGSIRGKDFKKELDKLDQHKPDPGKQTIFQRGSCLASSPRR